MKKWSVFNLASAIGIMVAGIVFAAGMDSTNESKSCKYCGMDRSNFSFSRMMIEYDDGTIVPTCSLHCSAVDLAINLDKTPKMIAVGDFNSKEMIDAEKAYWVVGGNKPGVMSKRGKWAFEKKHDAESFIKTNGGSIATFDEAIQAAYVDAYEDTKMIREKRKKKRMQMKEQKS